MLKAARNLNSPRLRCLKRLQHVTYLGFVCTVLSGWANFCLASGLSCLIPPFSQGLNFLIPLLDRIRYVQSLKEIVINVPEQSAVTLGKEKALSPALSLSLHLW